MTSPPNLSNSRAMQRVLVALERKPSSSASDISAEAFIGVTTLACGGYLKKLKAGRLIHVSGWRKVNGRFSTPLYSLGDHADVVRPKVDDTCRDAPGMWKILHALERFGPLSYREISEHSGLSPNTVKNSGYLSALIAQGFIHVGGWKRSHRGPLNPVYRVGKGTEAPKPAAISGPEKSKQFRTRRRISAKGIGLAAQVRLLLG